VVTVFSSYVGDGKPLRDRSLGVLIFVLALVAMLGYFWWLFLSPDDVVFLGKTLSEWAIIIPVVITVYFVLFLVAWIGWALASTAPPLPIPKEPPDYTEHSPGAD
jgi:hypothetical protein